MESYDDNKNNNINQNNNNNSNIIISTTNNITPVINNINLTIDNTKPKFLRPDDVPQLHRDQMRVINVLRGHSKCNSNDAIETLQARVDEYNKSHAKNKISLEMITNYFAHTAPITINVKLDTIKILFNDTHYRSIFETHHGGGCNDLKRRTQAEDDVFFNLYQDQKPFDKPKYGAVNYLRAHDGVKSAQMYGTLHFTLVNDSKLRNRITIATGDTFGRPKMGVLDYCNHVITAINKKEFESLVKVITTGEPQKYEGSSYREVQIHGEILLSRDIESLSISHTEYDAKAQEILSDFGEKFGIKILVY